tara:strand:- start:2839 stop:3300 length:462 start_codon:yes stop_codon:yes gene_type:complete
MAIILNNQEKTTSGIKPIDKDKSKAIGIELPIRKSDDRDGYFDSTYTSFDAIRNNIRCLLQTKKGERMFNPTLGLMLDNFLFENLTDDLKMSIAEDIQEMIEIWLPFVTINRMNIFNSLEDTSIPENQMVISIEFYVNDNPNLIDIVTARVGT